MFVVKDKESGLYIGTYWSTGFQLKEIDRAIVFTIQDEAQKIVDRFEKVVLEIIPFGGQHD
jgi:hypothetical protein